MSFTRDDFTYARLRNRPEQKDSEPSMESNDREQFFVTDTLHNNGVKYRSGSTRLLVFLVVLFALATVALAVVLAYTVLRVDKDEKCEDKVQATPAVPVTDGGQQGTDTHDEICLTEGCVMAAARVRSAMDTSINPCDDFYNFACGTWVKQHVIPEDKSSFGTFTKLRDDVDVILKSVLETENKPGDPEVVKKARQYYTACMDEAAVEALGLTFIHEYMEELGGLPALGSNPGGNWNQAGYNLITTMVKARKGTNYIPIIDVGVTQDDKNPTKYILYVDQPDVGMPSRDYYLKERNDTTLMAYQTMVEELFVAFGADEATAKQDAKDFVDFEIDLANITVRKEDRRDPEKLYNKMTVGDLSRNFSGINWLDLISGTFQHINLPMTDEEPVLATAPPFLEKIGNVISSYSTRVLANYIVGMRVIFKTFYLPPRFTEIKLKYQKVLSGTAKVPARWQSCSGNVKGSMPEVVGRLFVETAFKEEAKADVLDLVGKLGVAFKGMIDDLPWMAGTTKQVAKEKADAIEPRIGYSDLVYEDNKLNERYENLTVYAADPLKTLVSSGEASVIRTLQKLRKNYDKSEWHMSPATVNAYYSPETNQITFPAAILQPPFYTHNQPAYLNYGGIGYVIGHEITHGFDDQGRLYDKDGNLNSWWSDEDGTNFKARAKCIIDQYTGFVVPGTGNMTLNGVNTQGENIADNGGIKESFKAYRHWVTSTRQGKEEATLPGLNYTPNQLYFLNAAQTWCENVRDKAKIQEILTDPHSLTMYRVYGPMQNFDEFSKAWNCPLGSFMNRRNKCAVW